jgi:hypothetical protein
MKKIGTITLDEITFLSDPCYTTDTLANCVIQTIEGDYNVYITMGTNGDYKNRITNLIAIHKDYNKKFKTLPKNTKENLWCAVDSGTCGIFNGEYFAEFHTDTLNEEWYQENVINMDKHKITNGMGVISSSGLGDGYYSIFAEYDIKESDKAFAIRISYK